MRAFGDPKFKPAQQGELDALCGVYAAANFLFRRLRLSEDCEKRRAHFQRLLDHLGARKKITVFRVCEDGFKSGQIQAAFNKTARDLGLKVQARNLGSVLKKRNAGDLYGLLSSLEDNEAAMVRIENEHHWILVHSGRNDRITLDDAYPPAKCVEVSKSVKRLKAADLVNGLVFLNAPSH